MLSRISPFVLLFIVSYLLCSCDNADSQKHNPLKALADSDDNYVLPSKNNVINFPDAHRPKKGYRQEWWYLTANLTTEDGQSLATQWTLFRRAVEDKHWYFAHAALADHHHHLSAYRDGREELGNVVMNAAPFSASIDDWQWSSEKSLLPAQLIYGANISATDLSENTDHWQAKLNLSDEQVFYLQGANGFSQKHHTLDIASHYYSQPFIKVSGEVFWQGRWQQVTGTAWLDREWGSRMLAPDQQGWDWFSLRLDNETALMVYRIRSEVSDYLYGSVMSTNGEIKTLSEVDIQLIKVSDNSSVYPQAFTIKIAEQNIDIRVEVVNTNQIMRFGIEYFEGMVTFSGSHKGTGFLEMTGYR